jgi:hypothetical protein
VVRQVMHLLDPLTYAVSSGTVRRHEPKRDRTVSARQWKKRQKEARRGNQQ